MAIFTYPITENRLGASIFSAAILATATDRFAAGIYADAGFGLIATTDRLSSAISVGRQKGLPTVKTIYVAFTSPHCIFGTQATAYLANRRSAFLLDPMFV